MARKDGKSNYEKVKMLLEDLNTGVEETFTSDNFKAWLSSLAKLHDEVTDPVTGETSKEKRKKVLAGIQKSAAEMIESLEAALEKKARKEG